MKNANAKKTASAPWVKGRIAPSQIKAIHARYRVQFQQLQERSQAEVRAVLTAEQRTKFDARQAQMRERMAERDSSQRKAGQQGMQGRRPMRGARPGRPRGQN